MKTSKQMDTMKFNAGRATAFADAKRGKVHEPLKSDDPSWAAGYREECAEMAATHGADFVHKLSAK